jgi:hypothetical protein
MPTASVPAPDFSTPELHSAAARNRPGVYAFDLFLIVVFLLGIYTNYTILLAKNVPFPSVPAGVAGLILLWRRRGQIPQVAAKGFAIVMALYVVSILIAPEVKWLPRRLNGLIQLTYSIIISFALFLTVTQGSRKQIAILFLSCALFVAIGCLLETYGGLRPVSDAVRRVLYNRGLYDGDLRDILYYDQVRPKFFASEPASVTFCYTLLTFLWFVISRWRWKLPFYLSLFGLGILAMPGPTLLLMLALVVPYILFLASRRGGRLNLARLLPLAVLATISVGVFLVVASVAFPNRGKNARSGDDPSTFYRVRGPAMAGVDIMTAYPFAGAGLTGEPFIERRVTNLYIRSPYYSARWAVVTPATELLINYFWLHWIYLGIVMGAFVTAALTAWLLSLGVPSPAFCWIVWAILGQASGAYVGPTCWAVLFLAGAAAIMNQRVEPDAPSMQRTVPQSASFNLTNALQRRRAVLLPTMAEPPHSNSVERSRDDE